MKIYAVEPYDGEYRIVSAEVRETENSYICDERTQALRYKKVLPKAEADKIGRTEEEAIEKYLAGLLAKRIQAQLELDDIDRRIAKVKAWAEKRAGEEGEQR